MTINKTKFLFLIIFLSSFTLHSQEVKISDDKQSIEYAKIFFKDKKYYRNTNVTGKLQLAKDEQIAKITAVGYEDFYPDGNASSYILIPKTKTPNNLAPRNKKKYDQGTTTINDAYKTPLVSNGNGNTFAHLITNKFTEPTFLKKIKFITENEHKKTKVIFLKFFKNKDGLPEEEIFGIPIYCKNGTIKQTVNLSKENITFPKEGLFVGFEWINISDNEFDSNVNKSDIKDKLLGPKIIYQKTKTCEDYSIFENGKWMPIKGKNYCIAPIMEIQYSN